MSKRTVKLPVTLVVGKDEFAPNTPVELPADEAERYEAMYGKADADADKDETPKGKKPAK